MEEVAQWSVERKLFHAQCLGALDAYKNEQASSAHADDYDPNDINMDDYDYAPDDMPSPDEMQAQMGGGHGQSGGTGGVDTVPTSASPGEGVNPAARHDHTYNVADEDTDWEFCPQCRGLFEPDGEFEAHFESPEFNCEPNRNA